MAQDGCACCVDGEEDDHAVAGVGDGGGGDGRRSGGESKCAADRQTGDRGYSHRFLMKTMLRPPSDVVWETPSVLLFDTAGTKKLLALALRFCPDTQAGTAWRLSSV